MQKVDYTSNPPKDIELVAAIKANSESVLKSLYTSNYPKIEALVLKNSGSKAHAKDIYQDAFIAVWRNVKEDKFVPKTESSLNGYLYTIAKNKWMDFLRSSKYKKTVFNNDIISNHGEKAMTHPSTQEVEYEQKLEIAMSAFNRLGEACKQLLKAFYFEKKSMNDLAEELNLDTASVKNKKYRCMKKLRELAQKESS